MKKTPYVVSAPRKNFRHSGRVDNLMIRVHGHSSNGLMDFSIGKSGRPMVTFLSLRRRTRPETLEWLSQFFADAAIKARAARWGGELTEEEALMMDLEEDDFDVLEEENLG